VKLVALHLVLVTGEQVGITDFFIPQPKPVAVFGTCTTHKPKQNQQCPARFYHEKPSLNSPGETIKIAQSIDCLNLRKDGIQVQFPHLAIHSDF
jgi:hypothetical protein